MNAEMVREKKKFLICIFDHQFNKTDIEFFDGATLLKRKTSNCIKRIYLGRKCTLSA